MSKITTADCVDAINQEAMGCIPSTVGDLNPKWKRLSKSGRTGELITRVFSSKEAPFVKAVVEETPDGRLRVSFAQRHLWECNLNEDIDWDVVDEWLREPEIQALPGPVPSDFRFGITVEEEWEGRDTTEPLEIYVFIVPVCRPDWDQHLGIGHLLPRNSDGSQPYETSEATYEITLGDADPIKVMHAMIARGFIHDTKLDGEMGC